MVLEFNNLGILSNKVINIDDMNNIKLLKKLLKEFKKNTFMYGFSHPFEKVNAPSKNKRISYPAITAKSNRATMFVIFIIGLTAGPAVSL